MLRACGLFTVFYLAGALVLGVATIAVINHLDGRHEVPW